MTNSTVYKFLIYFFSLYPLFAIFSLMVLGSAPNNITGSLMVLILFYVLLNTKTLVFNKFLLFYALFFIYITVLDFFKLNYDFSPIKFLYANKNLHFLIFLMLLQIDNKVMNFSIRNVYAILLIIVLLSVIVIIIQQFSPRFFVNIDIIERYLEPEGGSISIKEELRSPSIYSWSSRLGVGFIFIPFSAIIINKYLIEKKNFLAFTFLFLCFLVAILSKARWVMINALILFIMGFRYNKKGFTRSIKIIFGLTLSLILAYNVLLLVGINIDVFIANRILETDQGEFIQGSAYSRLIAFEVFFKLFPQEPIFGVGTQVTKELYQALAGRSSHIHVGYLTLFYQYGIIGGLLYVGFIYSLTKSLINNMKIHKYYAPFYSWIGFLVANLTLTLLIPFEAGILLVLLLDKYYLIVYKNRIIRLSVMSVPYQLK